MARVPYLCLPRPRRPWLWIRLMSWAQASWRRTPEASLILPAFQKGASSGCETLD